MDQRLKDQFAKGIYQVLKRNVPQDKAVDLSEKLLDTIELLYDMANEEAGIASVPDVLRQDPPLDVDMDEITQDTRPHFLTPPPAKESATQVNRTEGKRLIAMPGDKDFKQPPGEDGTIKPGKVRASMVKQKAMVRPGSNAPQKQHWAESDLIQTIVDNTPDVIPFDIADPNGNAVRIVAKRNVINKQGLGSVVLTYKDDRMADTGSDKNVLTLVAQVPFSLYDEEQDFDESLTGDRGIIAQLQGIYRDRSSGVSDPVAVGPEPDMNMIRARISAGAAQGGKIDSKIGVGDAARIELDPSLRISGNTHVSYEERSRDAILQSALQQARRGNDSLAPAGKRFST
jgi:hypothetical protein